MPAKNQPTSQGIPPDHTIGRLAPLAGEWKIEVSLPPASIQGHASFQWLEGGAFLMMHSEIERTDFPTSTAVFGVDDSNEAWQMLYFDSRGVARIYQVTLADGVLKMWRDAPGFSQRFTGTFSEDGRTITARWEKSFDGSSWEHDFDMLYTKL